MGNLNETEKWEENIYQLETSDPVLGGADGISNRAPRQLANRTKWLKKKTEEAAQSLAEHVRSRNHPDATLTAKGFTQLSSATNSTSETQAATPKAVKAAYDLAAGKAPVSHTHPWSQITGVPAASLTAKGTVQLSSATDSQSETGCHAEGGQGCIRPCSRQGARQPHSPVESDNGSACCLADGKRHRTTEQRHQQHVRNTGCHAEGGQGCIRPCSRQGARQPHSPVESDNGSACCLADGKRHRTIEQ